VLSLGLAFDRVGDRFIDQDGDGLPGLALFRLWFAPMFGRTMGTSDFRWQSTHERASSCEAAHTMSADRGAFSQMEREGAMQKVLVGLALAATIATPAPAQNYNKNFAECAKEVGFNPANDTQKLSDGRTVRRWYFHSEVQQAAFNDCVARKAGLAAKSAPK
jgi:hypothetical protein